LNILEDCLNRDVGSVLFLEDDCFFIDEFLDLWPAYANALPNDWEQLYLGGQNLKVPKQPPTPVNSHWFTPYNVNRTHAYAIHKRGMQKIYKFLQRRDWQKGNHIDHHYGHMHMERAAKVYIPDRWLAGQRENDSDIGFKKWNDRIWNSASDSARLRTPFVLVLGLHSSGSSCLAMCLHHMGVHMGNSFAYRKDSGEAVEFANILEKAYPFPSLQLKMKRCKLNTRLSNWISTKCREASRKKTIAGAKYPLACLVAKDIARICGTQLKVVHIDRDVEESIISLQKREKKKDKDVIRRHQLKLLEKKRQFLDHNEHHTVKYDDLLSDPEKTLQSLADFIGVNPTDTQIDAAISHVNPGRRHISL
jgi:hypothetical protein